MAQVAYYPHGQQPTMDPRAGNDNENDNTRRFLPPPGIHPNSAVFGAASLPKPLTWQRREHLIQRRNILGRIGQLLKRNAQLVLSGNAAAAPAVTGGLSHPRTATGTGTATGPGAETPAEAEAHAKTWALARKLEVLLFLNSASLLEYSNVDSLARRVQALTASVVNKKIRREVVTQGQSVGCNVAQASVGRNAMAPTPPPQEEVPVPVSAATSVPLPPPTQSFTEMMRGAMAGQDVLAPPPILPPLVAPPPPTAAATAAVSSTQMSATYFVPSSGNNSGKRSASQMTAADHTLLDMSMAATKRVRTTSIPTTTTTTASTTTVRQQQPLPPPLRHSQLGQLLFRGVDELNTIIWSYVDGVEVMRARGVSRAAYGLAPLFVGSLQMSCNATQRALNTFSLHTGTCILRDCVNLRALEVVSLSSGMAFGKLSMRAMNCPQRFVVTHDDHEQIVLALSEQLRSNAFPRLTRLGLTTLFTNEEADGEADVLLNNLMTGCCPQLEELCLPGNSFGDYGAMKIAQMLRSSVCPKLTRLDLRRNFISEEGIRSICHALADGCAPNLVELCLGGNTITDSCFHHVLFAMESRKLEKLRFLGIEMNYLTATSMEMLGRTIGKLVCPLLSQISYSDNSVDNADAKRMIATAVYQERMFRLRQQQLRHQQRLHGKSQSQQAPQSQPQPQRPMMASSAQAQSQHHNQHHQQQQTQYALPQPHPTSFPYRTQDFPPPTSMHRGGGGGGRGGGSTSGAGASGGYFGEAAYSSEDDDAYSSEGE